MSIYLCNTCRIQSGIHIGSLPKWNWSGIERHFRENPNKPIQSTFVDTSYFVVQEQLDSAFVSGHVLVDDYDRTGLIGLTSAANGIVRSGSIYQSAYGIYLANLDFSPHGWPTTAIGEQACFVCGKPIK